MNRREKLAKTRAIRKAKGITNVMKCLDFLNDPDISTVFDDTEFRNFS